MRKSPAHQSGKMQIKSFADFWPFYVRQHVRPRTRLLHAMGSVLAVALFALAFAINLWILVAVPIVGYSFAWYAHFFVEHNKPATFGHPFYSLAADYRMLFLMMAGRMDEEVERYAGASQSVKPQAVST
jgi:hypothetical protein